MKTKYRTTAASDEHQRVSRPTRAGKSIGANLAVLIGIVLAAQPALAGSVSHFSNFNPLVSSVPGGSLPEATPLQVSSPRFSIKTISVNDAGPLNGGVKLGDNWDMNTVNENGPQAGRFLFTPYEIGTAGVRRLDLQTGQAVTLVNGGFTSGDASRWTPFGTYLTGEETTNGRLFELKNPLAAPGSANFVHVNVIPRVAHEGLAFDKSNNMYFVDELNGGKIYKFTSTTPTNGATFFNAGQTFVLKANAAGADATGAAQWVPITDVNGAPLPGVNTVTANGVTSVDGRQGAAFVGGTSYNRPEDVEIQSLPDGTQILYFAATDPTGKVFSIKLIDSNNADIKLFADRNTLKRGTTTAVGNEFLNPDNLAIDADANIYIVEDQPGGSADIWFGYDADRDGIAESLGRWASLSTLGAEPTGLYFNPFDPNVAYMNVQHANSDLDRTIQISAVPEPLSLTLLLTGGLSLLGVTYRRRRS